MGFDFVPPTTKEMGRFTCHLQQQASTACNMHKIRCSAFKQTHEYNSLKWQPWYFQTKYFGYYSQRKIEASAPQPSLLHAAATQIFSMI